MAPIGQEHCSVLPLVVDDGFRNHHNGVFIDDSLFLNLP